jgi:hypothetical protein
MRRIESVTIHVGDEINGNPAIYPVETRFPTRTKR